MHEMKAEADCCCLKLKCKTQGRGCKRGKGWSILCVFYPSKDQMSEKRRNKRPRSSLRVKIETL